MRVVGEVVSTLPNRPATDELKKSDHYVSARLSVV